MEALVSLASDIPVIGKETSSYLVETFIDEVIDYHNNLENELPTKYVVFYFYETNDTSVVEKTVDLLEEKQNEVNKQCTFEFYLFENDPPFFNRSIFQFGYALQLLMVHVT